MTVYNVNLGIGWASSGVEYAQSYRAQLLRSLKIPAKFIFSDMILANNIQDLTSNLGFTDDQVIWFYNFFTDMKIAPSTYLLSDWKRAEDIDKRSANKVPLANGKTIRYTLDGGLDVEVRLHGGKEGHEMIDQVSYSTRDVLLKRDFYSYAKYATEYYSGDPTNNFVVYRDFYNEDGSIAYTEHLNGKTETFEFPGRIYYSKNELYKKMLDQLDFQKDDTIIIDRMDDGGILINGQLIFENHGPAKLVIVVHADHFDKHYTNQQHILWNNFYEYQFTHTSDVDAFVVSTDAQKQMLVHQFKKYEDAKPLVVTIPVGSLPQLIRPEDGKRKPYSMITASRLAPEKHVDWLVHATVQAHAQVPEIALDIYGEGIEREKLQKIIQENNASDYIHLKGQQDLTKIYSQYSAYVAASTSEGFGLSLMEAVGSGLPMLGFDVPYGNPTFIQNNKNGHLLAYNEEWQDQKKIDQLAAGMIALFTKDDLSNMSENSYKLADNYLSKNVAQRWQKMLEGFKND